MTLTTLSFSDYYVHASYWCVTASDKDKAINLARLLFAAFEDAGSPGTKSLVSYLRNFGLYGVKASPSMIDVKMGYYTARVYVEECAMVICKHNDAGKLLECQQVDIEVESIE